MTSILGLTFAGIHSSDMPVIINKITRPFSLNVSENVQDVFGKNGNVWMGNSISSNTFSIDITVTGNSRQERINNTRIIANWLFQIDDYSEQEMIFDEEPDKAYYGHFVGSSTMDDNLADWGTTTLTFVCSDPFAYKEQIDTDTFTASPAVLDVQTQVKTKPIINVKVNDDITSLALINNDDDYIYLGNPTDPDQAQSIVNQTEKVLHDDMSSVNSWQSNTDQNYIDGIVAGQFKANNYALYTENGDYGSGPRWHGPSLKKFIGNAELQDFKVDAWVSFKMNDYRDMGIVRVYLIDANNKSLGYISLKSNNDNPFTIFQCKAGTEQDGHDVCYTGGSNWKVTKKEKQTYKKKVNGKWKWFNRWVPVTYTKSKYYDFYGVIEVKRIANVWTATIIGMDPHQKELWRNVYTWTDKNNKYTNAKLSGVAIWNAQWSSHQVMGTNAITDITIYKVNNDGWENPTQIPVIASSGDEIMIDCESHKILKNGENFMTQLLVGSSFFNLSPGTNAIGYAPDDKVDIAISYRPKYQ